MIGGSPLHPNSTLTNNNNSPELDPDYLLARKLQDLENSTPRDDREENKKKGCIIS